jgi:hypothetical protein
LCRSAVQSFPVDTEQATTIALSDDGSVEVNFSGGKTVSFFGQNWSGFHINSNGSVSFSRGSTQYEETLDEHFAIPRVSALFHDLNPAAGGRVSWQDLSDRVVVSFENVPEWGTSNFNSFQYEFFTTGRIRITWLGMTTLNGIVGLSQGDGLQPDYRPSDFSLASACTPDPTPGPCNSGDADGNLFVNAEDYQTARDAFGEIDPAIGDADCDGFVNTNDFRSIQSNFGTNYGF